MATTAASSLEAENQTRKTSSGFHRVSVLMIQELFPFHGGCPPVCFSTPFNFCCRVSLSTFPSKRSLLLQINHKYPERRLLVAESCGALAPYLPVRTCCAHSSKKKRFCMHVNYKNQNLILLSAPAEGDP